MTLQEAINHCNEIVEKKDICEGCKLDHIDLRNWLCELQEIRRNRQVEIYHMLEYIIKEYLYTQYGMLKDSRNKLLEDIKKGEFHESDT